MDSASRLRIIIPGPATPERKRSRVINGHAGRSDTPEAKSYKNHVKACAAAAMDGRAPLEGPLALEVVVYRLRPKSAPKRVTLPITKPDVDNYIKILSDSFTGIVWRDDAQIVRLRATKLFAETCRVEALISTVDSPEELREEEWREEQAREAAAAESNVPLAM